MLGIKLEEVKESYDRVSITVTKEHFNMHSIAHDSFIFAIANAAFEYVFLSTKIILSTVAKRWKSSS